jgi:hypothetical protein
MQDVNFLHTNNLLQEDVSGLTHRVSEGSMSFVTVRHFSLRKFAEFGNQPTFIIFNNSLTLAQRGF